MECNPASARAWHEESQDKELHGRRSRGKVTSVSRKKSNKGSRRAQALHISWIGCCVNSKGKKGRKEKKKKKKKGTSAGLHFIPKGTSMGNSVSSFEYHSAFDLFSSS